MHESNGIFGISGAYRCAFQTNRRCPYVTNYFSVSETRLIKWKFSSFILFCFFMQQLLFFNYSKYLNSNPHNVFGSMRSNINLFYLIMFFIYTFCSLYLLSLSLHLNHFCLSVCLFPCIMVKCSRYLSQMSG